MKKKEKVNWNTWKRHEKMREHTERESTRGKMQGKRASEKERKKTRVELNGR